MVRNADGQAVRSGTCAQGDRCTDARSHSSAHPHFLAISASLLVVVANESPAQARRPSEGSANPPFATFVTLGSPTLSIGSADKEGPTLFGTITGVAADGSGNIYVLDRSTHSVRVFSSSGRFLGSAGRPGRGPGDLSWPHTLFHDKKNTLFVIDRVNGVVTFETRDGALSHRASIAANFLPNNACLLGEKLIVPAWRDQKILHVFDRNGQYLRSFGDGFNRDTSEAVREVANQTQLQISCDSALNRIFVAPIAIGEVRAYDSAGQLVWQQRLEGFDESRTLLNHQGVVTVRGKHYASSLLRLGDDLLLLQVRHREPVKSSSSKVNPQGGRGYWETRAIVSYILSARSGRVVSRSVGAPLIGVITPGFVVAFEDEPFPRVTLLPWREVRR